MEELEWRYLYVRDKNGRDVVRVLFLCFVVLFLLVDKLVWIKIIIN